MRKLLTSVALAVMAMSGAHAADKLTPYTGELPEVLKYAAATGLKVFKKFDAADGFTGWVVQDASMGKHVVLYTTPSGKTLMAGMMLDNTGTNLTAKYLEEHIPAPDYMAVLEEFKAANVLTEGNPKAKAEVVVAYDPNCGYCKRMHQMITPAVEAGDLKVTYLPVGILGADSVQKAAGLFTSKDLTTDLNIHVSGGAAVTSNERVNLDKVKTNTDLMRKHGFNGTPVVLYTGKTPDGEKTVFVSNGLPRASELFSRLGIDGHMDKLKQIPSLKDFVN